MARERATSTAAARSTWSAGRSPAALRELDGACVGVGGRRSTEAPPHIDRSTDADAVPELAPLVDAWRQHGFVVHDDAIEAQRTRWVGIRWEADEMFPPNRQLVEVTRTWVLAQLAAAGTPG